jgi:hypothetical protein
MKIKGKFILLTREEFKVWLLKLKCTRDIKIIQEHHTYIPNYTTFKPEKDYFKILEGMEQSHINRGFSEIAQNITVFPDGLIAICRDFNKAPAGIMGANTHGICIENVGNFDIGGDKMQPEQRHSILFVTAVLCEAFKLKPSTNTIVYHHWYDLSTGKRTDGRGETKSCPGSNWFGGNTVQACRNNFITAVLNVMKATK